MLLRRASVLAVLTLSLGSAVAFTQANWFPQATAQNTEEQPEQQRPEPGPAQNTEEQPEQRRPERGPGRDKARLIQELNLTPEQTQRLQAIQNQYQEQVSQRRQAARQARQELFDLMAGTASESQVREKYRQVETLKQQAEDVKFSSLLAMREVLTPEQRRQFAERMQRHR